MISKFNSFYILIDKFRKISLFLEKFSFYKDIVILQLSIYT